MRSDPDASERPKRSFIEEARRAQIIDGAITAFAERGYAGTSLARIADRIGISKGVISYHFAGKDELMEQVVESVYERITDFVVPLVAAETTAIARIGARIRAVARYARLHPTQVKALSEVLSNLRDEDGRLRYGDNFNESIYQGLEAEFRAGHATDELRVFDPRVMAVTVEAAIDAMISYWDSYPEHDITAHADELVDLFTRAMSADPSRPVGGSEERA